MDYKLEDIVKEVDRLPTLNTVAFRVIQLCSDNGTSIRQLVKVISGDQSLTAQILRVANSPYFNFPKKIHSLDRAIVILGFNLLRDIAVSIAIYSFYKGLKSSRIFNLQRLWRHSILTAFLGRSLAMKFDPDNAELFYLAGLLHDIGKVVLNQILQKDFHFLVEKSRQEGLRLDIIERKFLGFHHGEVGGELMQVWNLAEPIVQMVTYHHFPGEFAGDPDIARLIRSIYLGNLIAHYIQDELQGLEAIVQLDVEFSRYFSFSPAEFEELISNLLKELNNYQAFFEMLQI